MLKIKWPEGKDFAFSVFDDTDLATLENVREVYAFLDDLGFRTTKSVWPVRGQGQASYAGETLEDRHYLEWVLDLKDKGFEIGFHMATYHSSTRQETIRALERFREIFATYPSTMANHKVCCENIYWGNHRLTGLNEKLYNLLTRNKNKGRYEGHIPTSPYFWGDICRKTIKYVRNFVFPHLNTLGQCPMMPYHDPLRPYVNYWFASSEGGNPNSFCRLLSEPNQDDLAAAGGACIMYTHFGNNFYDSRLHQRFKFLMNRLSQKNGWFVPVSVLLDYLIYLKGHTEITDKGKARLERKWLWNKIVTRIT